jgi:hypothetical protein
MTSRDPTPSRTVMGPLLHAKRTMGATEAGLDRHEVAYWVADAAPATRTDKRSHSRARTRLRSGRILDSRNRLLAEASLHDRSSTGWRLRLLEDVPLPPRFRFYDDEQRRAFDADLIWRRGRDVGVGIKP